jgi:hypothetical protein
MTPIVEVLTLHPRFIFPEYPLNFSGRSSPEGIAQDIIRIKIRHQKGSQLLYHLDITWYYLHRPLYFNLAGVFYFLLSNR